MAKKPVGVVSPVMVKAPRGDVRRSSSEGEIDPAQATRNLAALTSTTSKFCRLLESNRQNYRIDRALEDWHTMQELVKITECSEKRIKSHILYIRTNCRDHCHHEIDPNDSFRFRFVCD